jgi:hypothetical protein
MEIHMKRLLDPETFGPWAVVTGASSGIGKEFARQLAANGLHVVLVARRLPLLEDLGHQLATTYGVQYRAIGVDLSEPDFLATLEAATRDPDVGLLISNAGAFLPGAFLQLDRSRLQQMVYLNVLAHLDVSHHFGQRLAARGRGGLLLVASTAGLQGVPFSAEYAAAKGFVLNLGEALSIIKQFFSGEPVNFSGKYYTTTDLRPVPRPVQQPHPPILIGSTGPRMVTLAAREADIILLFPPIEERLAGPADHCDGCGTGRGTIVATPNRWYDSQ